jgi:hypothetical protein
MPEDPNPATGQPADEPSSDSDSEKENEVGDFITRNVLDKDSVFFEG